MKKAFSVDEWRRERARGVILEYIRGVKPRATLDWCIGCLTKSFALGPSESMLIIQSIRNDPTVVWNSERKKAW